MPIDIADRSQVDDAVSQARKFVRVIKIFLAGGTAVHKSVNLYFVFTVARGPVTKSPF